MTRLSIPSLATLALAGAAILASTGAASCGRARTNAPEAAAPAAGTSETPVREATLTIDEVTPGVGELKGGASSPEALVRSALRAFAAKDTLALRSLLITRDEWRDQLYPEFPVYYPAARDTREETKTFLWENHSLSSSNALMRALRKVGGKKMTLVKLEYRDQTQAFKTYTIHQGTTPSVKMPDGSEREITQLGSIVEKNGVYKLLSFRDRD